MSLIVNKHDVITQLKSALDNCHVGTSPVAYHCDISCIGVLDAVKPRPLMLDDYLETLLATGDRTVIIPTFNYDYCHTKVYNVTHDAAQIGILNDHIRARGFPRSKTPIFHFCFLNHQQFSLSARTNPLGKDSTFDELLAMDGWIGYFGAGFDATTFLHFMEERMSVGYRYLKRFDGKIITPEGEQEISIVYRVRPRVPLAATPRWNELEQELKALHILHSFPLGNGRLMLCRATALEAYWAECLRKNEFYFLTEEARGVAQALYNTHGSPLILENIEGT